MRVAVDIDSVIADLMGSLIPRLNQEYDLNLKYEDITTWDHPICGHSIGEDIKRYLADPKFVLNIEPIEGSIEAVRQLHKKHEVIVATGRPNYCKSSTLHWLIDKYPHDKVVFGSEKTVQRLGAQVLVDDASHYLDRFLKSGGIMGILMSCPWNQKCNTGFRAANWNSILEIIDTLGD